VSARCCTTSCKIGIYQRILLKPGRADVEERAIVELHPRIGYKLGQRASRAWRRSRSPCLHHHERWDGTGYPGRLKGEQIPLEARASIGGRRRVHAR
jgi:putative two-component system response regulator